MKTPEPKTPDPVSILSAHVLSTLPDSLAERIDLLQAIYVLVNPRHGARKPIADALIDAHNLKRNTELAQLKFAALLGGTPNTKPETSNRRNGPSGNGHTPAK